METSLLNIKHIAETSEYKTLLVLISQLNANLNNHINTHPLGLDICYYHCIFDFCYFFSLLPLFNEN